MPSPKSCYLAGPITGLTYGEARYGWRKTFAESIHQVAPHIECYSPMRQKEFLSHLQSMECKGVDLERYEQCISRPLGILTRDLNDVRERDCIVACFLGAKIPSIGTVFELGVARALNKPIVVVMEDDNPHQHVFVTHCGGYVTPSLDEAVHIVRSLLTPDL